MVRIELVKTSLLHLLLHIPRYTDYLLQTSIQIHCIFFSIEPGIIFFLRKWLLTPPERAVPLASSMRALPSVK